MPITKEIAELVVLSAYVDTCALKSTKTVVADIAELDELITRYGLNKKEIEKLCIGATDLSKDLFEIAANGRKNYVYNGHHVSSSYVEVMDSELPILRMCINKLHAYIIAQDIKIWVFIIIDYQNNQTIVHYISENGIKTKCYEGIVSRGSTIMPVVEKQFYERSDD